MLARGYNLRVNMGNEEFPFCICNAKLKTFRTHNYVSLPTTEELEAPALEIIPLSKNNENFYAQFSSGYIDEDGNDVPVGDEVMKAIRGQSEDWKVIRCSMDPGGLIFVVVNPKICALRAKVEVSDTCYGTYEGDLKEGRVFVYLNREVIRYAILKVKVKKYKKGKLKTSRKYRIVLRASRVEFTEYYKHFKRISDIECETDSDDNEIYVREFYD